MAWRSRLSLPYVLAVGRARKPVASIAVRKNILRMMASVSSPPEALLKPINVPSKTLMGPGPSNAPPRVLAAGSLPILGHLHSEFTQIMDECKAGIQYLFQTQNTVTLAVSGTGHAAMEMACDNMVETGENVLVVTNGIWGCRFSDMVTRHGANAVLLEKQGEPFGKEEIEKALQQEKPTVMFITHGESSSALLQPIDDLGHLCHKYNCLLIVDSVAAAGGVPVFMDQWGIDVLYTGGQKCLGAPPGASPISFSSRAYEKFQNRKTRPASYYMDLGELANYWGCDGTPARRYHHTGPITSIYQLRESLALLAEEGLEAMWVRHASVSNQLKEGIEAMGLELYIKHPANQLPTITGVVVPDGVDWKAVSGYLMTNYRLELSGGLGHSAGKIWRVGLMGYNARPDVVTTLLRVLKEAIDHVKA